ncbi:hypothetical protein MP228_000652 [Amoeboaphelidium protococcarum]|nr:hypothetical protein MP228_000652 [Amoeboaphelidium protococcarum]
MIPFCPFWTDLDHTQARDYNQHSPRSKADRFFWSGTGPSFDHSVQDRAQTEPLVLDRRQTGPDRSKRYISVTIVTMT